MSRFLITQSLLSSWQYQYGAYDPEAARDDFIRVLSREPTEQSEAMCNGLAFEQYVMDYCAGKPVDDKNKWKRGIERVGELVHGSVFQLAASREITVEGLELLLYGRLDALKAGIIRDIKFSKTYEAGKYYNSPQHPMYLACVPEAKAFEYVISNGADVYVERYTRVDITPIEDMIRAFLHDMRFEGLLDLYRRKWEAKE